MAEAHGCANCMKQGLKCSYRGGATTTNINTRPTMPTTILKPEGRVSPSTNSRVEGAGSPANNNSSVLMHDESTSSSDFSFLDLPSCDSYFDFTSLSHEGSKLLRSNMSTDASTDMC